MNYMLISIFLTHFFADFVFQTDWMAKNKSKETSALFAHIGEYVAVSYIFNLVLVWLFTTVSMTSFLWFIGINAITHLFIDFFTSKATSYLWKKQEVHNFFVVIGFDQFLHSAILIWSAFKWLQ